MTSGTGSSSQVDDDYAMALALEQQFAMEDANEEVASFIPKEFRKGTPTKGADPIPGPSREASARGVLSIIAPEWEDLDPTPDLQALFIQFDKRFFWGQLAACEVRWSPRMTLCAGICSYSPRQGYCSIRLSVPLLKLRPRKDLVETLLHEMIHAYLFVTDGNDDHDGHGPAFHKHMNRINGETGTKISVYHSFHDEVALYKQHWWKCNGPCVNRKPFYGMVKRSMNRAPGPNDIWWKDHQSTCGGSFIKVKEPEGYGQKKGSKKKETLPKGQKDIRSLFPGVGNTPGSSPKNNPTRKKSGTAGKVKGSDGKPVGSNVIGKGGGRGNIFGFGGTSFGSPGGVGDVLLTKGKIGSFVVNPGWKAKDNSSSGHVVNGPKSSSGSSSRDPGGEVSSETVRAKTRDVWLSRFSANNGSSSSNVSSSETKTIVTIDEDLQECPVCSEKVPSSKMNEHLDECLTLQSLDVEPPNPKKIKKNPFDDDYD